MPHLISGLNKRALLQAELEFHERKIALCQIMLAHFDATLALYEETKNAKGLRRRYLSNRRSDLFEYGLVSRLVVDVVRGANGPLSTFEILARVTNGLESPPSSEGSRILYGRLRSAIANKVRRGIFRAQRSRGRFMTFEFIGYPIPYPIIPDYKTHGRGEQRPTRPLSELKLV